MKNTLKNRLLKHVFDHYIRWRLTDFTYPEYPVMLEYPIKPEPRYGEGKPPHPELTALLSKNDKLYLETLTSLTDFSDKLARIPESENTQKPEEPFWENTYFSALDAITLYSLLGWKMPANYLEVGSGNSTKFARRAVRDFNLSTKITSLDPHPRAEVDSLCDRVIREPLENVDSALFNELGAGDVLFIDNSHRAFQNSDVTVFFLEILPRLKSGITVHIHDMFLPFDYPNSWANRHYSEQYLLAAYLLSEYKKIDVLLPLAYAGSQPAIREFINRSWCQPVFQRAFSRYGILTGGHLGTSFWLTTR